MEFNALKVEPKPHDTDMTHDSPHHTLGYGATQAAPGNTVHNLQQRVGPNTQLLVPAAGWIETSPGYGGLGYTKHAGMVTTNFMLKRNAPLTVAATEAITLGILPVGFRPLNEGTVVPAIVMLAGVRQVAVGVIDTAGTCFVRFLVGGTLAVNSDYVAVNATFPV